MPEAAITQVEDRVKTILQAYVPLAGQNVIVAESLDIALDETMLPAIIITTSSYSVDVADEHWSSIHTMTLEVEAVNELPSTGTISRTNRQTLAHVNAAIAVDRSLGIKVHDIQEQDMSPTEPRGKDVDSASLQYQVQFFTSRSDWFTIV